MTVRVAAALTWDGARFPAKRLPVKARAFLGRVTPATKLAGVLAEGTPMELRVCWVPKLRGGPEVLCAPFTTSDGKRVAFRLVRMVRFGDVLGAVYRRQSRTAGK
jgi:hypothetical protein